MYRGRGSNRSGRRSDDRTRDDRHFSSTSSSNRAFLQKVIAGEATIGSEDSAVRFFRGALEMESLELIFVLADKSRSGPDSLKRAFSLGFGKIQSISAVVSFLARLGDDILNRGAAKSCTEDCYLIAYNTPGFLLAIKRALLDGLITENISAIAWWLVGATRISAEARENPLVNEIAEFLSTQSCAATVQLATLLIPGKVSRSFVSGAEATTKIESLGQLEAMQPQHDNDFPFDYRKIAIIPSAAELNCGVGGSGIQTVAMIQNLAHATSGSDDHSALVVASLLDRQFRLLREDMIAPTKEELREELKKPLSERRRLFLNPELVGLEMKPRPCILIRVEATPALRGRLRKMNKNQIEHFMDEAGKRLLGKDSMVLFLQGKVISHVGVVVRREKHEIVSKDSNHLMVGVNLVKGSIVPFLEQIRFSYSKGNNSKSDRTPSRIRGCTHLFQASSSLFSYKPVLSVLQNMTAIPFEAQIAHRAIPAMISGGSGGNIPPSIYAKLAADPSQLAAVEYALSHNVSLIQGPPGTGKTFLGVQIATVLIQNNPGIRILCLCYTNHALDSFLESLLDSGMKLNQFIRLGSSPKISDRLKERCLNEVSATNFSRCQSSRYASLKRQQENAAEEMKKLEGYIGEKQWGPKWWKTAEIFLKDEHPDVYQEFLSEDDGSLAPDMTKVGRKGKASSGDELWVRWCTGKSKEDPKNIKTSKGKVGDKNSSSTSLPSTSDPIWATNLDQRRELLRQWERECRAPHLESFARYMAVYEDSIDALDELRAETKVGIVKGATLIGCTTTSAAKHRGLLENVRPNVVIVEEAGEILECHILTNLYNSVERLIMIGDHQQLPPKLEFYDLRKESGKQVNFDESLFERLALQSGFPVQVLNIQHRMRPEISAMVRNTTYPTLQDHQSVLGRENIKGIASVVAFVCHKELESGDEDRAALGTSSKINLFEVEMVALTTRYLLWQGYAPSDIVILTPYLGQLAQIQKALVHNKIGVEVGDFDRAELARSDFDLANVQDSNTAEKGVASVRSSVRVATVDNYQGEESKLILASLVRSNEEGNIGFLSSPERVNVLFSRARDGFYLFGNADCLRNARSSRGRNLWNGVLNQLDASGFLYSGLPIICQCGRDQSVRKIQKPAELYVLSPEGGCALQCGKVLKTCPHGHVCNRKCHPPFTPDAHDAMLCTEQMPCFCPQGHPVMRLCHSSEPDMCRQSVRDDCHDGHIRNRLCSAPMLRKCGQCDELRKLREAEEKRQREQEEAQIVAIKAAEEKLAALQSRLAVERAQESHLAKLLRLEEESGLVEREYKRLKINNLESVPRPIRAAEGSSSYDVSHAELFPAAPASDSLSEMDVEQLPSISPAAMEMLNETVSIDVSPLAKCLEQEVSTVPVVKQMTQGPESTIAILSAARREDWIRVHEMSKQAFIQKDIPSEPVSIFKEAIHAIAEIELGEDATAIRNNLSKMKTNYAENARMELNEVASIAMGTLLYALAIAEAKVGGAPLLSKQAANEYLSFFNSRKEMLGSLPSSWFEKAQEIADLSSNSKVSSSKTSNKSAANKWASIVVSKKSVVPPPPPVTDDLMKLVGLESVKQEFIKEYEKVVIAAQQGIPAQGSSYNLRCDGNPGTGKTTVAKIYGTFLTELGVLPKGSIVELTSGSALLAGGITALKAHLDAIKSAGGGVVFVDESYQLNPKDDRQGRQILDFILQHSERISGDYGDLVWVFAGYEKHMTKLFEHNPGLPSRFPLRFKFEDYSDDELLSIFLSILRDGGRVKAPPPASKPNKAPKATSIPMKSSSYIYGYLPPKPDQIDEWGNTWRWSESNYTYEDDWGNITGYGASALGSATNPLISTTDNSSWMYDRYKKVWTSGSRRQEHYPNKTPQKVDSAEKPTKEFTLSDLKWARIAMRRLGKGRGLTGFGNARAVRSFFDDVRRRQGERLTRAYESGFAQVNIMEFVRDDLLGPRADQEKLERCSAWGELLAMEGLVEVKQAVKELLQLVVLNADREDAEKPMLDVNLNRVFLGNPGTGKTTVARLYAQILKDLGLLSKGEVILKNPSDFVGSALGQSEERTRAVIESAAGSVLVIDEAYGLNPAFGSSTSGGSQDPYKVAVIDTIVEQVQGLPGADQAVILLGYRKEMEMMMAAANPGLSRRFQLENAYNFSDYDDSALVRILRAQCKKDGLVVNLETASYAISMLARARAQPNFGNAGAVNNLLSAAKLRMQTRLAKLAPSERNDVFLRSDFASNDLKDSIDSDSSLFSDLVGCDAVVRKLEEYRATMEQCKSLGRDPREFIEWNFVFAGSPGTGKTTVARRMGRMFSRLGLLPCEDVVEVSASDLITGYVGQAGKKTLEVLTKARGKVLFIDEAYQLNPTKGGAYMQEVVDELVKGLTHEDFKGRLITILAGYDSDMNAMLDANQGLRSRFSEKLVFEDFSPSLVAKMLKSKLEGLGIPLAASVAEALPNIAERLTNMPKFGNGRDVETLSKRVFRTFSMDKQSPRQLDVSHINSALDGFLEARKNSEAGAVATASDMRSVEQSAPLQMTAAPTIMSLPTTTKSASIHRRAAVSEVDLEDVVMEDASNEEDSSRMDYLAALQTIIDSMGLNTRDGVRSLRILDESSVELGAVAQRLSAMLGISLDAAFNQLREWQVMQENVEEQMHAQEIEQEKAKAERRKAMLPIWRCGVCGQADKPWIVCYVAPFIVRYEEVDI